MTIGSSWKPVQCGMKLSTATILSLHQHLVVEGELKFIMSGRFSQDALENIFSQIRSKGNMHPKPVQFRWSLRLVCLAQFMAVPSTSSYEVDDTPHLINFITANKKDMLSRKEDEILLEEFEEPNILCILGHAASSSMDVVEANGLYYVAGWSVFKELKKVKCMKCNKAFSAEEPEPEFKEFSTLTWYKSYDGKGNLNPKMATNFLCHPSKKIFNLIRKCEVVFRSTIQECVRKSSPECQIVQQIEIDDDEFPKCHTLAKSIIRRYVGLRLNVYAKEISKTLAVAKQYASKTAARSCVA